MANRYEQLVRKVEKELLSNGLSMALRAAIAAGDEELATWLRLELLGYVDGTPGFTGQTVPEYRTVTGQWFDEFRRPLVIDNPDLAFINETRLRHGVVELESLVGAQGTVVLRLPEFAKIIQEQLDVHVIMFRFAPQYIPPVLANIKAHFLEQLATHHQQLERAPDPRPAPPPDEIIEIRPNFYGIGINLRALWRRLQSRRDD